MGQLADLEPVCSRFEIWNIEISYRSCHKMSFQIVRQTYKRIYFIDVVLELTRLPKTPPKYEKNGSEASSDHFASHNKRICKVPKTLDRSSKIDLCKAVFFFMPRWQKSCYVKVSAKFQQKLLYLELEHHKDY